MIYEQDIQVELGRLPQSLEDLYEIIYDDISALGKTGHDIAIRTLQLLLCTQRRLTTKEMLAAVTVDSLLKHPVPSSEVELLSACCNMVVLDKEVDSFRFAHLSVREFLEKRADYEPAITNLYALNRCLSVFLCDSGDLTPPENQTFVIQQNDIFRRYSTAYWPIHFRLSEAEVEMNVLLQAFVGSKDSSAAFNRWANSRDALDNTHWREEGEESLEPRDLIERLGFYGPTPLSILYVSCKFGLSAIVRYILPRHELHWNHLEEEIDPEIYTKLDYSLPIEYAVEEGFTDIIKMLHGHQPNFFIDFPNAGAAALVVAVTKSQAASIKILMDLGVDKNGYFQMPYMEHKCTLLSTACGHRNVDMVKLLLSHNADPNIPDIEWDSEGRITSSNTPLWVALGITSSPPLLIDTTQRSLSC